MKRTCLNSMFAALVCCVAIAAASVQSVAAKSSNQNYESIDYNTVKVEHDWANPAHYLTSEQIIEWANGYKSGTTATFPSVEATEKVPYGSTTTASASGARTSSSSASSSSASASSSSKNKTVPSSADGITLRTNMLYWLGGIANLGAEYRMGSVSAIINGGYGLLYKDDWKLQLGGWFVAPEVRYYMGSAKQWFVGAQFLTGAFKVHVWPNTKGLDGTVIAGGLTGGYKLYLSPTFDMDLSLGLGYGRTYGDRYYCSENGPIPVANSANEKKSFIMPIQLGVNLIWKVCE